MSISRRIAIAVSASWLSRAVVIGLSLLLIPILFQHLGKEELGLWFMLGQSGAFLTLMDLGVTPTLTRRIAFAAGKSGGDVTAALTTVSTEEIANLVASGRVIYRFLSIGVFLIAWATGFAFLTQLQFQEVGWTTIWLAWTILCLGHAFGVWASLWGCLLQGMGHVAVDTMVWTLVQTISIVAQVLVVMLGGELIELAFVVAISSLATRYLIMQVALRREPDLFSVRGHFCSHEVKTMIKPALNSWIIALGGFLILKTDQYFIAYFQGSNQIPAYHAAYQVILNLSTVAIALALASRPFISRLWQSGERMKMQDIFIMNARMALGLMASGIACVTLVGKELIDLWLGSENFIGYPIIIVFCIMLFLQTQHQVVHSATRATEYEPFAICALVAGVLNILFTLILIQYYGLLGVALGTLLAQAVTLNWYVIVRGLPRLGIAFSRYISGVVLPVALTYISAWTLGKVCILALPDQSHAWMRLFVAISVTGLLAVGISGLPILRRAQSIARRHYS